MTPERRAKLEAAGYTLGDAADFLGMDEEERRELDEWDDARDRVGDSVLSLRVRLGREIRRRRDEAKITQADLARLIGSTAPRVSRIEGVADGVGLDLMFRAYFAVGGTLADLARGG